MNFRKDFVLFVFLATLVGCASFQHQRQGSRGQLSGRGVVTGPDYAAFMALESQDEYLNKHFGPMQARTAEVQANWMTAFYANQQGGGNKEIEQKVDRATKALDTYFGRKAARLIQGGGTSGAAPTAPVAPAPTSVAPSSTPPAVVPAPVASPPVSAAPAPLALPPASEPPTAVVANPVADKFEEEVRAANNYSMLLAALKNVSSHDASGKLAEVAATLEGNVLLPSSDQRERFPSDKEKIIRNLSGFRLLIK